MIMAKQFGLGKRDRLKSRREIDTLFEKGKHFSVFPLRVIYRLEPAPNLPTLQAGVTASKRHFKKAVDRNLIKRRIREGYRLNKNQIGDQNKLVIAYIYSAKEILPSAQIHEKLVKTFKRFDYAEKN